MAYKVADQLTGRFTRCFDTLGADRTVSCPTSQLKIRRSIYQTNGWWARAQIPTALLAMDVRN